MKWKRLDMKLLTVDDGDHDRGFLFKQLDYLNIFVCLSTFEYL